jgi:putative hydrolase of the HAD superfamily
LRAVLRWDDTPIEAVLLDLDDTLLDNQAGLEAVWAQVSEQLAGRLGDVAPAAVRAQLEASSDWFWSDDARHRSGRLDMPASRCAVVSHLLEALGRPDAALAGEVARFYSELRDASLAPIDGAFEALARLRAGTRALGLVTNGAADAQRAKIERFELARWFDVIVVEGELGVGKPDARVFAHAIGALRAAPSRSLMAGDNYECDVLGALRAGLHAVWIQRDGIAPPPGSVNRRPPSPPRAHRTLRSFVELVEQLGA